MMAKARQGLVEWNPLDNSRFIEAQYGHLKVCRLLTQQQIYQKQLQAHELLLLGDHSTNIRSSRGDRSVNGSQRQQHHQVDVEPKISDIQVDSEIDVRVTSSSIECTCISWHSHSQYNAYAAFGLSNGSVCLLNTCDSSEVCLNLFFGVVDDVLFHVSTLSSADQLFIIAHATMFVGTVSLHSSLPLVSTEP
jgi:hypothetical protein